jgi:hypothetical protein
MLENPEGERYVSRGSMGDMPYIPITLLLLGREKRGSISARLNQLYISIVFFMGRSLFYTVSKAKT